MAFNLFDNVSNLLNGELLQKSAKFLGESETSIRRAWSAIVPAVASAIVNRVNGPAGAEEVYSLAARHNMAGNFSSDKYFAADILEKEHDTIHDLFGGHLNRYSSIVSQYSGIKAPSVFTLTSIASSASLGLLGEQAASNKYTAAELALYLNSQKPVIMNSVPPGLDLSPVFGQPVDVREPKMDHGRGTVASPTIEHEHIPVMKTRYWLTPTIILAVIAIFCLYRWSNAYNHNLTPHTTGDSLHRETRSEQFSTENELHHPGEKTSSTTGSVDSLGNYIYNTGTAGTINLPGGSTALQAGSASTEAKLVNFLNDANSKIDSVKGNWFEFTGVTFKTGSAELTPGSNAQLQNMVAISKAYPEAKFKIGGYTDNVGDATVNKRVSQQRAEAVQRKLIELGMASGQLTGAEGYGAEHPVGDNNTEEGKAMNRRVAVSVKAK